VACIIKDNITRALLGSSIIAIPHNKESCHTIKQQHGKLPSIVVYTHCINGIILRPRLNNFDLRRWISSKPSYDRLKQQVCVLQSAKMNTDFSQGSLRTYFFVCCIVVSRLITTQHRCFSWTNFNIWMYWFSHVWWSWRWKLHLTYNHIRPASYFMV